MKLIRQVGWGRALGFLLLVWVMFLLVAVGILRHEPDPQTAQRISQAFKDLQVIHQQRLELNRFLSEYSIGDSAFKQAFRDMLAKGRSGRKDGSVSGAENADGAAAGDSGRGGGAPGPVPLPLYPAAGGGGGERKDGDSMAVAGGGYEPTAEYERARRRLKIGVDEMWYFVSAQVKAARKQAHDVSSQLARALDRILDEGAEHKRSLLKDMEQLSRVDGHSAWRENESRHLSELVQERIRKLQNPADCSKARKLLCSLNKGCGYGCQLHHIVYCMLVAYGTERTMVLKSKGWRYHRAGWEDVYKPVSDTCLDPSGTSTSHWPGTPSTQVVQLPIVDSIAPRPPYLPLAVPSDLAERISRLHGNPFVWWVGQFFKYLLRPQPATLSMTDAAAEKMKFKRPIVGVHIRRTDKIGTEAAFHSVDEYMAKVAEYYDQLARESGGGAGAIVRRIYLASDDPRVFVDVRLKYPGYEILGDPGVAKTAAVATRYSDTSLNGIITDIHFLSLSDYLVCTFSSQVCRVAYEIMQSLHPDASDRFASLDDIYYYGGQNTHRQVALEGHTARSPDQMGLEPGDTVAAFGNHWDGFSMGRNLRTNQVGLYPSFKVQDMVEAVDFPTYATSDLPAKDEANTT